MLFPTWVKQVLSGSLRHTDHCMTTLIQQLLQVRQHTTGTIKLKWLLCINMHGMKTHGMNASGMNTNGMDRHTHGINMAGMSMNASDMNTSGMYMNTTTTR